MNSPGQLAATARIAVPSVIVPGPKCGATATFVLPPLPFAENALEPCISAQTVHLHYRKHHRGYIDALNARVAGTEFSAMSLTQLVVATAGLPEYASLFDLAAQAWNHAFYWQSLKPLGGSAPAPILLARIESSFGTLEALKAELVAAATAQFGSGWVWLVADGDQLRVVKTANAKNPLTEQMKPLLAIDVWEHAYYLDFQNRRADYVKQVLDQLINWEFANRNLYPG
jgi:Fe-Mn family superoxide dismutase